MSILYYEGPPEKEKAMPQYTLVQHSGFGYAGDLQFRSAVETREVTPAQARKIAKIGGRVCPDYISAEDAGECYNYPPGAVGMIPQAVGTFADLKVDGLAVFIPFVVPVHYVTDPEADESWVVATLNEADEITVDNGMIVAIQREKFHGTNDVKVEWRWVLGTYDYPRSVVGQRMSDGQEVVAIQSVMETV